MFWNRQISFVIVSFLWFNSVFVLGQEIDVNDMQGSVVNKRKPQDKSESIGVNERAKVMTELKQQLQKTSFLSDLFGGSSLRYSSRGKDDKSIETVHSAVGPLKEIITEEQSKLNKELDELYGEAIKLLGSSKKNKRKAYEMLEKASRSGHTPSRLKIAWEILLGGVDRDLDEARKTFVELAEIGVPDAHMALGFLHSIGITVKVNQAKALVHYMLAALGGNVWALIVLGYRYKFGLTVLANCEKSLQFYELAAMEVADRVSFSGGIPIQRVRLTDLEDNNGFNAYWLEADLVQYYEHLANKGDVSSQVTLGKLFYHGLKGCPRDIKKAEHYFRLASDKFSSTAQGYLGRIYLENEEFSSANDSLAFAFFKFSADQNNAIGLSGLGLMYLEGRGVDIDYSQAKFYFSKAADFHSAEGHLYLGIMFLKGLGVAQSHRQALKHFLFAAQTGHVLAYYHLAKMHSSGDGILRSCNTAVELYKNVVERGKWNEIFVRGTTNYQAHNYLSAFLVFALLSELGYETAQSNAAFMLEKDLGPKIDSKEEKYARALSYWRKSAQQENPTAYIKLGDYYYYGHGVEADYELAAHHYRLAFNQFGDPQALFNLGYMHEQGLGMPRDLALAKRFYDLAAEVSPDAYVPVCAALTKLALIMASDYVLSSNSYTNLFKIWFALPWDFYALFSLFTALCLLAYPRLIQILNVHL